MLKGHGGNIFDLAQRLGCDPFDIVDMSSNVNPLGPLPGLVGFLKEKLTAITALPEVDARNTAQVFAARYRLESAQVLAGNGTTQFIYTIPPALDTRRALILGPTYADYADSCGMHNVRYDYLMTPESLDFEPDIETIIQRTGGYDTVFICNPNNPTGTLIPKTALERLCRYHPDTYFVIDESYLPFVNGADRFSMLHGGFPNVLILNSMSKIFRIPGLRIGFLISSGRIIEKFRAFLLPWSVNSLAQTAVDYLMKHTAEVDAFIDKTVAFLETERKLMTDAFEDVSGIKLFSSKTSFILAKLQGKITADMVCNHLAADGILIRNCSNFKGLSEHFIRISLKTDDINKMLAEKITKFLGSV
ncbi:MAG: aminotransferase class I/II-fold pyridoxal phosphate-dependent enzyme [Pseudomonadota bacterium]|uniref:Pyridoxal phosphate-dependent class II aminotransferase n=1 Tax=Candidatus Desulfatibia profunda TaxID=2841695 RepID=A0A8J6NU38_9BACT|nr:pyridoxal phosphate-dependent class II aminotransferase [Candidatus Desulfatibia profunda]MBL7180352.1 pyridoxal phosphate-dependent class II aminotransferase [Desulfobacterales bacterium]